MHLIFKYNKKHPFLTSAMSLTKLLMALQSDSFLESDTDDNRYDFFDEYSFNMSDISAFSFFRAKLPKLTNDKLEKTSLFNLNNNTHSDDESQSWIFNTDFTSYFELIKKLLAHTYGSECLEHIDNNNEPPRDAFRIVKNFVTVVNILLKELRVDAIFQFSGAVKSIKRKWEQLLYEGITVLFDNNKIVHLFNRNYPSDFINTLLRISLTSFTLDLDTLDSYLLDKFNKSLVELNLQTIFESYGILDEKYFDTHFAHNSSVSISDFGQLDKYTALVLLHLDPSFTSETAIKPLLFSPLITTVIIKYNPLSYLFRSSRLRYASTILDNIINRYLDGLIQNKVKPPKYRELSAQVFYNDYHGAWSLYGNKGSNYPIITLTVLRKWLKKYPVEKVVDLIKCTADRHPVNNIVLFFYAFHYYVLTNDIKSFKLFCNSRDMINRVFDQFTNNMLFKAHINNNTKLFDTIFSILNDIRAQLDKDYEFTAKNVKTFNQVFTTSYLYSVRAQLVSNITDKLKKHPSDIDDDIKPYFYTEVPFFYSIMLYVNMDPLYSLIIPIILKSSTTKATLYTLFQLIKVNLDKLTTTSATSDENSLIDVVRAGWYYIIAFIFPGLIDRLNLSFTSYDIMAKYSSLLESLRKNKFIILLQSKHCSSALVTSLLKRFGHTFSSFTSKSVDAITSTLFIFAKNKQLYGSVLRGYLNYLYIYTIVTSNPRYEMINVGNIERAVTEYAKATVIYEKLTNDLISDNYFFNVFSNWGDIPIDDLLLKESVWETHLKNIKYTINDFELIKKIANKSYDIMHKLFEKTSKNRSLVVFHRSLIQRFFHVDVLSFTDIALLTVLLRVLKTTTGFNLKGVFNHRAIRSITKMLNNAIYETSLPDEIFAVVCDLLLTLFDKHKVNPFIDKGALMKALNQVETKITFTQKTREKLDAVFSELADHPLYFRYGLR